MTSDVEFVADEVQTIIKTAVDEVLPVNEPYVPERVGQWTSEILENVIKRLAALQKPFKYVTTCVIMQKTGAGMCTGVSCWWDNQMDGSKTFKLEHKNMFIVLTVFGLSI